MIHCVNENYKEKSYRASSIMPKKNQPLSPATFDIDSKTGSAVGHIASGLFVICAGDYEKKAIDGYLASWVQQVSFDPLMISIAIKPGRPSYDLIMSGIVFTVNIVGHHNSSYMNYFWQGYDPKNNPFDKLQIKQGKLGGIILEAAKSAIECKMHSSSRPGDHEVVIASVLNCYVINDDSNPLVHVRKTGLDY
jgi:flavin reductase (DIM6/NTAB) family NADH-FMN oxidoreductase RutF